MVDFNNETTVTRPAADIIRVLILQRRNDVIDSFEFFRKSKANNIQSSTAIIQSRLFALFLELQAAFKRRYKEADYTRLLKRIESSQYADLYDAFLTMNEELDKLKLTQIDTGKVYDSTRVEEENKAKNL